SSGEKSSTRRVRLLCRRRVIAVGRGNGQRFYRPRPARATTAGIQPLSAGCLYTACRPGRCPCPEMLRIRTLSPPLQVALLLVASVILPARAQLAPQQTVIQVENVRTEYARVLRA